MSQDLQMLVGGALGVIIQALYKISMIDKRSEGETYKSVLSMYLSGEWVTLLISFVVVGTCVYISSEYLTVTDLNKTGVFPALQYNVLLYIKTTFVCIGFCANTAAYAILGQVEKKIIDKTKE